MNGLRQAALKGTMWSAFQQAGDRGLRVLIYVVLARLVDPDAFGVVALAAVFIELGYIVVDQGLSSAVVQRDRLEPGHLDAAFWGGVLFSAAISGVMWLGAPLIAHVSREPEIEPVVRWLTVVFPINALASIQEATLRRELQFRPLAIRSFLSQIVGGGVAVTLALLGFGVWSLVALEIVRRSLSTVVLWTVSEWRPGFTGTLRQYWQLLRFGASIMGVKLVTFLRNRSDFYLVGAILGTTPLGYYSIARQLVNAATTVVNESVFQVMWSTFSRLQREPRRLARAMERSTELLATIAWPVYVGGMMLAPELVAVGLGERWSPSIPIVQAFLACSVILVPATTFLTAITAIGETRLRLGLEVGGAALTLSAIGLALPMGIGAVAWAYAASVLLLLPLQLGASLRRLPAAPSRIPRLLLAPAIGCLSMAASIALLSDAISGRLAALPRLAFLACVGACIYVASFHLFFPAQARQVRGDLSVLARREESTEGPGDSDSVPPRPDPTRPG